MSSRQSRRVRRVAASRHALVRAVSLAVIITMITQSAAASPRTLLQWGVDARASLSFWYNSSRWADSLLTLLGARGSAAIRPQQETQSDRDARVADVKIYPDSATIKRGQREFFGALALDTSGQTVGGVKFTWTAVDETRKLKFAVSQTGEVKGIAPA